MSAQIESGQTLETSTARFTGHQASRGETPGVLNPEKLSGANGLPCQPTEIQDLESLRNAEALFGNFRTVKLLKWNG